MKKKLNVTKVIDQWGWSYDFIGREQQRYTRHNIVINKYDNVDLNDTDVLYIHSPNIHASLTNLPIIAHKKGIKVIGAYGGDPKFWPNTFDPKYKYADLIITISPETYIFAKNLYKDVPVIFLPECVDTNFFVPAKFDLKSFNVGWAGSKFPLKRVHILESLKYHVNKQSEWGYEFFQKDRTQETMLKFYQFLNVFVLSSTTECMPRVILEAMACGLPVISTRVGNLPFILEDKWLISVYPDSAVIKEMNCGLDLLKKDVKLRKETSERNRKYIDEHFSWKVNQKLWDDVFSLIYKDDVKSILKENENYMIPYKHYFQLTFDIKKQTIVYVLPGTGISGGIAIMLQHVQWLLKLEKYNVFLFSLDNRQNISWYPDHLPIVTLNNIELLKNIDILIFSGWQSVISALKIDAKRKIYFVQSDERRFFDDEKTKKIVHQTYEIDFEYMTEAIWIQKWLKEEFNHNAYYVPNALDQKFFYKTNPLIPKTDKPRILIEGAIAIPFKGVNKAYQAVKDLDCEIWFVSNSGKPDPSWRFDKFFEKVPFEEMRQIYSSCDILIKMSSIEGFFGPPMEAMACGCSVVVGKCTGYDEYIQHDYNALVVENYDISAAKSAIESIIKNPQLKQKLIDNGYITSQQWNWQKTLFYLEKAINQELVSFLFKDELKQKREIQLDKFIPCDIILVTYNACEYVKRCVDSIKKYTKSYNLIIIDNNSDFETKNYLSTIKDAKIIFNDKNNGFGYANNQGIQASNSKYVCMLNSDTIVTENWLENLITVLEQTEAGMVGPITNYVSNECQKADLSYNHLVSNNDDSKIHKYAKNKFDLHGHAYIKTNRLIGFCLLSKRETLQKTGLFDDRFYPGCFEDDDLCLRMIERGYELYCASGIFIYHFGGESFNKKFKTKTHSETLKTNEERYNQKWYNSQRIKSIYTVKKPLSIIYLLASDSPSGGVKVVFEHANRLKLRGHDVKIYCAIEETGHNWFPVSVPIIYGQFDTIPESDITIGTYFTTLPYLKKTKSLVKIHFCQGYELLLYDQNSIQTTIKNDYQSIKTKIVVSKWLKEIISEEFEISSILIPNGIDQYVFSFQKHQRNNIPRILIVGTDQLNIKGVDFAIEAMKKLSIERKIEIVRLSSFDSIYRDIKCEYHDMSKMSQNDIAKVYESCDLTICVPFKVEGFSLPPLESMASGTPVITSDSGGMSIYAINGYNCAVVPPKNSEAIYRAAKFLLDNTEAYKKYQENGLTTVNGYIWYKQIDKLESTLHTLYDKAMKSSSFGLSVCMIVKNEEQNLERCLKSVKDIATELIVVDTGSSDNTIQIAKKYGALIYHFVWNNDFSKARNYSLLKASQPWILVLDADETISSNDIPKLKSLIEGSRKNSYNFVTRSYVNDYSVQDIVTTNDYEEGKEYKGWCKSTKVRLFPNDKNIKFEGQIHELVEKSLRKNKIQIVNTEVPVHHYGYINKDKINEKNKEYVKLSEKKFGSTQDLKSLVELGIQYMALNNYDEALVTWRKALELNEKNHDILSKIGTTYNLLEDYEQAEKYFLKSLEVLETEYAYQHLGICYAKREDYEKAYSVLKKIAYTTQDLQTKANFAHCCNTLRKFDESISILEMCLFMNRTRTTSWGLLEFAYNEKGIELVKKGKLKVALRLFQLALQINPDFKNARNNINEVKKALVV